MPGLERWSNLCGDAMAMVFFESNEILKSFWTHVLRNTIATDSIKWKYQTNDNILRLFLTSVKL